MTALWRDSRRLRRLYHERGLTQQEVADELGCSVSTISIWLRVYGIQTEDAAHKLEGRDNPAWVERATFTHDTEGYERAKCGVSEKAVQIHRLAAVAWFGWDAVVDMDVHHEDGIPWDNRESNLEPLSHSEHARLHAEERAEEVSTADD